MMSDKPRRKSIARNVTCVLWSFALAACLLLGSAGARAQLSSESRLADLQNRLIVHIEQSDYQGALTVIEEIRSLGLPVPESVLYAEGLSLLAVGRAAEAERLLSAHLAQAGPDSLFYNEIVELRGAARRNAGGGAQGLAQVEEAESQSTAAWSQQGLATGQGDDYEPEQALARPEGIATEWELRNQADAREWTRIRYSDNPGDFDSFVAAYPQSRFAPSAEKRQRRVVASLSREGYDAYQGGDFARAQQIWRAAAGHGDAYAQTMLGLLHDQGQGVPRDYGAALDWYRQAAEQGNTTAQTNIGVLYYEGNGVPQDSQQARDWLLRAADQSDRNAQLRLGILYQYGRGNVPQDLAEATRWFRLAAAQGSEQAAENLRILGAQ